MSIAVIKPMQIFLQIFLGKVFAKAFCGLIGDISSAPDKLKPELNCKV